MPTTNTSSGYSSQSLLIVAVLALLLGAAGGWFAAQQIMLQGIQQTLTDRDRYPELITTRIDAEVDLRPEQRDRIEQLVDQRLEQFWKMSDFFWPLTRTQIDATADEIRQVLDEDQRREFDAGYQQFMNRIENVMAGEDSTP